MNVMHEPLRCSEYNGRQRVAVATDFIQCSLLSRRVGFPLCSLRGLLCSFVWVRIAK